MKNDNLNRFDRIIAILIHLQSGRVIKAQELANRFKVSLRTVYRDIRSLEACGVPICGEAGVGYSLTEGYRLPPVMFTREEAGSFVAAEKLMQKFSDKTLGEYYASAMYKVKSVLRSNLKDQVAVLETKIWINSPQELFNEHTPDALNVLLDSIAQKKQVALRYQAPYSNEISDRLIEPIGLFNENNYWYVKAYCLLRAEYRHFRADRMLQIKQTALSFTKEHSTIANVREAAASLPKTKVVFRVDRQTARFLTSGRKYYGFESEKIIGDQVEMTFMTSDIHDSLPRWFLMFGDCAEIIEPESFRERVSELLEKTKMNLNANN
jgi:predicted DNA-binding transcriptional regulator YafY